VKMGLELRFLLGLILVFSIGITGCGAENSDAYAPTTDTITTTALITVDADAIHIVTKGPSVQSELIEECTLGFEQEDLAYSFSSSDELILGGQRFDYVRPLVAPLSSSSSDSRLFAVWKLPAQVKGQVTYTFEVEIRSDTIIYRNTCVR
jgi:hypothetical protein